jgi:acetyl-CoA carboxylase carboxyl transferase subunit alpha
MLENTWYTVIAPESCSSILWRNWDHKEDAANALNLTPQDALREKFIDGIIEEPLGGAHYDPETTYLNLKNSILQNIKAFPNLQDRSLKPRDRRNSLRWGNLKDKK